MTSKALNRRLVSALMAGVVGIATSLACAAPGGKNAVSDSYDVNFSAGDCATNTACLFFSGYVYPQGVGGVPIGDLTAGVFDFPNGHAFTVSCTGPQYAAAVSANAGGAASVKVTLDPEAPGCSSIIFFSTPSVITIDLTGHADGESHTSITGIETDTFDNGTGIVTIRLNTQTDCYSEAFAGTIISPIVVADLQGRSCLQHRIQL